MAPTRPSIMSDGAMMSQPASASTRACLTSTSTVSSLRISPSLEQAVMAVAGIGIERDVAQDADVGHFLLDGADGAADEVVRVERLGAGLVAQAGVGIGEQGEAGDVAAAPRVRRRAPPRRPKSAPPRASSPPGCGCVSPSMRNSGQIRSSAVSTFSRTMRRAHSDLRLRRWRVVRSSGGAPFPGDFASTGENRTVGSSGRPNFMAMNCS